MKRLVMFCLVSVALVLFVQAGFSHCQIPCGIYGDQVRVDMMKEDITTIEKAMNQINTLSAQDEKNYNQIVRWVNAKEDHANKIMETVSDYFLAQRIEFDTKAYKKKLIVLHEILVYAMKAKQSTDLAHVEKLKSLVEDFHKLYFKK
ncbi:superoxide dismutase [Ni] [Elusimicrobiota bacterium]